MVGFVRRMEGCRVETEFFDPALQDAGVSRVPR
jgi:hypothetical protein